MKAETLSLTQLFSKPISLVVPLFQRPYVWEKGKHWIPLWEDIRATTQRLLAEQATAVATGNDPGAAEEKTAPHFLGAVVLEQIPGSTGMIEIRNLIDGQQRVTTLQLFLDAAHDVALEFGNENHILLGKLTENDPDMVRGPSETYKVWPTNFDQDAFRLTMGREALPGDGDLDVSGTRLWQAHEYFSDAMREWLSDDDEPVEKQLDALRTTLFRLVRIVVIDLESNDNAQVIFETLNARGTPLLASDLIKNFIFREAADQQLPVDDLYNEHWKPLDDEWWREEVSQGRLQRPRLDIFFFHWLTMRTGSEFGVHELFPEFKLYTRARDVESVLADVHRHAKVFRTFDDLAIGTYERTFFYRLRAMEQATVTPALLLVLGHSDDQVAPEQKVRMMRAIESWLVRRMLCRLTTKNYNQVFLALLGALLDDPGHAGDVTVAFLRGLGGESQEWPSDEKLYEALLSLPLYRVVSRGRLRMVLEALEDELRTDFAEEAHTRTGLSIEHILPQSWELNWPPPGGPDVTEAKARREVLKHSLGNLTLVTSKLNSGLSNDPWSAKHDTLKQHIVLFLNKDIVNLYEDTWDESSILERGRKLADAACRIWPAPEATQWPLAMAVSPAAQTFMEREASGAEVSSSEPGSQSRSMTHDQVREKVKTPFLESMVDPLEDWMIENGVDVRHKKGTHHSLYVGKRAIGGYYFAQRWIHFWLRDRRDSDVAFSHLSRPENLSLKDLSVSGNVVDDSDLGLFKAGVLDRL